MVAKLGGREATERDWGELLARKPTGKLYAVRSTGIVCCFGCPAPAPLRENLRLFDRLEEALSCGYRPCKRCRAGCSKL